ncbi:MAG: leucine-rich repeat protein [Methanomassiliicoccales archaeon]
MIPGSIDGKPVTSIADNAFYSIVSLTSVVIPYNVTSIGENAFASCSSLTSVTIPASVTSIGNYTFSYCSSLVSITIPTSVTSIGDYTFSQCSSLTSITIPSNVTSIGNGEFYECASLTGIDVNTGNLNYASLNGVLFNKDMTFLISCPGGKIGGFVIPDNVTTLNGWAFYDCNSLTSITIPSSVAYMGNYAFDRCSALTAINVNGSNLNYASLNGVLYNKATTTLIQYPGGRAGSFAIPNSVTKIGDSAFSDCRSLSSVTIPSSITSIGQTAFFYCSALTSVTIPLGVISVGPSAFAFCANLTLVTIPTSLSSIGGWAFFSCTSLTSITIPASITSIGNNAFLDCSALTAIDVNSGNLNYASLNGVLFNKTMTTLIQCPAGKAGAFIIPNSVTKIDDAAFIRCRSLTSVAIPSSITMLGFQMFSSCTSLTSVTIPSNVTSIGDYAFYDCENLTSVTIPDNATYIGFDAFSNCAALTSITIPAKIETIGDYAFYDCTSLTGIDVNPANVNYTSVNGVLYNKTVTTLIQYPSGRAGEFTIPNNVTTIGDSAFADSNGLTSVTVPANVLKIESSAFADCLALKTINVVVSNPNYASLDGVLYDKNMTSLVQFPSARAGAFVIPNNVTKIGDSAFYLCDLTSVRIPSSVTTIGNWSFGNSKSLTQIQFDGNAPACGDHWIYSFNANLKICYIGGALGFTTPTWFGVQTIAMFQVTGKVVDPDGKGLADITVALENGTSVKTSANGDFAILASSGDHILTVSGPGIDTKSVNVKVSGAGLAVGNISTSKSNDIMALILILIVVIAIAIVLVVVFVTIRRRKHRELANQPPITPVATYSAPVGEASPQVQTTYKNCPNCGAETMEAPFCSNCGKKLG